MQADTYTEVQRFRLIHILRLEVQADTCTVVQRYRLIHILRYRDAG